MIDPLTLSAIKEVGFPIVAAISVAIFLAVIGRWFMRRGDRLLDHLEAHVDKNDQHLADISPKLDKLIDAQPHVCRAGELPVRRHAPA